MRRRAWLGLAVGLLALVLALWGVPAAEIGAALRAAKPAWLLPVAALFLTQQSLRAARQRLLLRGAGAGLRWRDSLSVLCISFLFINTLPARLGEVVRPALLWERHEVPVGRGLAMVVVERVLDLSAAVAMLSLAAAFVPVEAPDLVLAGWTLPWTALGQLAAGVVVPLLGGLGLLLVGGRSAVAWLRRWEPRLWAPLRRLLRVGLRVADGFVTGLEAVRSPRALAGILALTVLTWGLSGWLFVCTAHAFGVEAHIGYGQGIGLLSITMLGTAVPSAPGFAGTYEAFLRAGLALYGVGGPALAGRAVAFALVHHWWVYGVQACTALYFLAVDRVDPRALYHKALAQWRQDGAAS